MKRCPPHRFLAAITAALLVMLFAVSMYGQGQTGNIYGKVQAKDGSVLPGVTVTLTGPGAPSTFVTDASGSFRFINLSPGTYALKAELAGFGTSTRQGISVNLGRNADVTMTLNPAATESITVTAEAPLLDVRKAGTGADITKVELEKVPTGRDPWVILQQTPGVLLDRVNVGGSESGQQSNYVGKGTTPDQSTWNVDGVNITDVGALGSSPTYYDFDSFEEMQITTGGTDPRIQTPGVQLNMVTKRGTNDIKGSARWFNTSNSLQANPKFPSEAASYLQRVNQIDSISDQGAELGGPVVRDRLWLWGAYAKQHINLLTATLLDPTNPNSRFLDKTTLTNSNFKLNAQPIASNSLTATDMFGQKVKIGRNASPARPPETTWDQTNSYGGKSGSMFNPTMWKIEDTQIFGPSLYLTGLYSKVQGGFQLIANNGVGCNTLECGLNTQPAYLDATGVWRRSYLSYNTERPQTQERIDGSTFFNTGTISHELKFGTGYRNAKVTSTSVWPGNQYTADFGDGTGGVYLLRPVNFTYSVKSNDVYVGDTMMFGNLTVQPGLRYDQQKGGVNAGTAAANSAAPALLPSVTWNGISGLKWTNVSPRLGLTYTVGADKRTLVRAAYSKYVDQMGGSLVYNASPGAYNYLYYYFTDKNNNHIAENSEIDFSYLAFYKGIDPSKTTTANSVVRWGSNLKAPTSNEYILGFEREVLSDFSVGVNGTYRKLQNFTWSVPEKGQGTNNLYTSADYTAHTINLATNCAGITNCKAVSFLPDGKTQMPITYYTATGGAPIYFVEQNRPDYYQTYRGLELTATKRMSNRWMMRGNVTLQNWKQHVGPGAIIDPTVQRGGTGCSVCNGSDVLLGAGSGSGAKGGVYINSKWAYNFTGAYQIPVIETSLGFNLTGRQGYALPYVYRVNTGLEGLKYPLLGDVTAHRNPNPMEFDLRLAKDIRISRAAVTLSVDGFNMLNRNTVLQRDVRRVQLASANRITELQSPRVFRLGARLSF
jgi:hypothetical protein